MTDIDDRICAEFAAIRERAGRLPIPARPPASSRHTPRRLIVAAIIVLVAIVAGLSLRGHDRATTVTTPTTQTGSPTTNARPSPTTAPAVQSVPRDCPYMIGDTLKGATVADLTRRGAADGLPYDGATTLDRVAATLRINQSLIRSTYREVVSVTIGPGLGWTYSLVPGGTPAYHHVNDYQIVVVLAHKTDCPLNNAFVTSDQGRGVPVLFQYLASP